MNTEQYRKALDALGLQRSAQFTADTLGISVATASRVYAGKQAVPRTVAQLLKYLLHDPAEGPMTKS